MNVWIKDAFCFKSNYSQIETIQKENQIKLENVNITLESENKKMEIVFEKKHLISF